jgi:hypothetical protein
MIQRFGDYYSELCFFEMRSSCTVKWSIQRIWLFKTGNKKSPITVAARSRAWAVFARLNIGFVGSSPTPGMDVCVRIFFVLFCVYVAALLRDDPPSRESYRLCIGFRTWKRGQCPKGYRAIERERERERGITTHLLIKSHSKSEVLLLWYNPLVCVCVKNVAVSCRQAHNSFCGAIRNWHCSE